ncbi:ECs_2282 family putative zinc-binding protein [Pseudomonas xanthosomatis]|uniref:ECs_2282 family putative zinc-binding protein n=1 Tax=Pseudomonas xanthosomatis TaxID=2842356 RepID=UPI003515D72F
MNLDKHSRTIPLHCPTCAGTTFESESPESYSVTCTGCERVITREDLRRENKENIQAHLGEIKKDISKAVADDLRKRLQKAFKGSKGFKLK